VLFVDTVLHLARNKNKFLTPFLLFGTTGVKPLQLLILSGSTPRLEPLNYYSCSFGLRRASIASGLKMKIFLFKHLTYTVFFENYYSQILSAIDFE